MDNPLKAILETQTVGILRVAVTMPIEHSLDRLKTHMQQKLQPISPLKTLMELKKQQGLLRALSQGFQPNLYRQILKQYYRWPMMIFIPNMYKKQLQGGSPILCKTLTGVTIGLFESLIICPLERWKVYRMTPVSTASRSVITINSDIMKFLYTGFQIQLVRQIVSWTSFLFWDHKIRYYFKGDRQQKLTTIQVIQSSFLTSILNIALVQPFDTVKTLYQMQNNSQFINQNIFTSMKTVYQKNGMRAFYAGWQMRIMAFFAQALLTTPTLDYLERKYGNL